MARTVASAIVDFLAPRRAQLPPVAFAAPAASFDYAFGPDEGHWVTIDGEHVLIRGPRPGHVPARGKVGGEEHLAAVSEMANSRQRFLGVQSGVLTARIRYEDAGERQKLKDAGFRWNPDQKQWQKPLPVGPEHLAERQQFVRGLLARDYAVPVAHGGAKATAERLREHGVHPREANIVRGGGDRPWQAVPHDELGATAPVRAEPVAPPPASSARVAEPYTPEQTPPRPALVGSPRQIKWATDIRRDQEMALGNYLAAKRSRDNVARRAGQLTEETAAKNEGIYRGLRAWVLGQQAAGTWIDRRGWSPEQWSDRYLALRQEGTIPHPAPVTPEPLRPLPPSVPAPAPALATPSRNPGGLPRTIDLRPPKTAPAPAAPPPKTAAPLQGTFGFAPKVGEVFHWHKGQYAVATKVTPHYVSAREAQRREEDFDDFNARAGWEYDIDARPATEEEAAPLRRQHQAERDARQAQQAARARKDALEMQLHRQGERPAMHEQHVGGEHLLDDQNIHGGGGFFSLDPANGAIWHVRRNGMDGDDWGQSNSRSGIASRIPYTQELADELRALHQTLHGGRAGMSGYPSMPNVTASPADDDVYQDDDAPVVAAPKED